MSHHCVSTLRLPPNPECAPWQIDIDHDDESNPGWKLQAASTPQGRILVGYSRDPKDRDLQGEGRYRLRLFDSADALAAAEVAPPENADSKYKNWFLLAGAGGMWATWSLTSEPPDDEEDLEVLDGAHLMDTRYAIPRTLMAEATIEARLGRLKFGASYAQDRLEEEFEAIADEQAQELYDRLYGMLGVERIIKYHDIQLRFRRARLITEYDIAAQDSLGDEGRTASGVVSSEYQRFDMFLLNTWRVRYGISHQRYSSYLPFYVWHLAEGDTEYVFVDSFSSEAEFSDFGLTVGYSRLDYAAKYENNVFDWFLDGDAGLGWSTAVLEDPITVTLVTEDDELSEKIDKVGGLLLPFNAELGVIFMRRSHRLRGFGGYARGGYRAEGSFAGSVGKPSDKDEASEIEIWSEQFTRFDLRHGPFFGAGIVF